MKLIDSTDISWEEWGKRDPYFGVCAASRFRTGNLKEQERAEFFETGRKHIDGVLSTIIRVYGEDWKRKAALDFGCGVGRLALPLAGKFESVVGLDVSPAMLAHAESNAAIAAVSNLDLRQSDDELSNLKGMSFDLVHSYIVFQHIPVCRGERLAEILLSHVGSGGVAALHFTLSREASLLRKMVNAGRKRFFPLTILVNLMQGRPWNDPFMQMNSYSLNRLCDIFWKAGLSDVHIKEDYFDGYMSALVIARRPIAKA